MPEVIWDRQSPDWHFIIRSFRSGYFPEANREIGDPGELNLRTHRKQQPELRTSLLDFGRFNFST